MPKKSMGEFPKRGEGSSDSGKIEDIHKAEEMAYAEKPFRGVISEKNLTPEQEKFLEGISEEEGEKAGKEYDKEKQAKESDIVKAIKIGMERNVHIPDEGKDEEGKDVNRDLRKEIEEKIDSKVDSLIEQKKPVKEFMKEMNKYVEDVNDSIEQGYSFFFSLRNNPGQVASEVKEIENQIKGSSNEKESRQRLIGGLKIALRLSLRESYDNDLLEREVLQSLDEIGEDSKKYIRDYISLFNARRKRKGTQYDISDTMMQKYGYFWSDEKKEYLPIE